MIYFNSDVAQSTANLNHFETRASDTDLKKEMILKKKSTSKISKGLIDFMSIGDAIGDAIGYADKKTAK